MLVSLTPSPPRVQANTEMCDVIRKFAVHVVPPHRAASISNRTASEAIRRWTGRRRAPTAPGHHHPPLQSRNQNRLIRLWKGRLAIFDFGQQCQCTNTCYLIEHKSLRDSPQEIIIRSKHHQEPPHIQVIIFMKARAHQPNIFYMHLLFNGSHDYYVCEVGWGKRRFFFFFSSSFAHLMILFAFLR